MKLNSWVLLLALQLRGKGWLLSGFLRDVVPWWVPAQSDEVYHAPGRWLPPLGVPHAKLQQPTDKLHAQRDVWASHYHPLIHKAFNNSGCNLFAIFVCIATLRETRQDKCNVLMYRKGFQGSRDDVVETSLQLSLRFSHVDGCAATSGE
jgi:hypothetical protein